MSLFFVLPVVLGWRAARQQHDWQAGIFLGLACAIKLFAGLFGILFLFHKRWRLLIAMGVSFILISLIPLIYFGPSIYLTYATTFSKIVWYGASWNASLLGLFSRVFASNPYVTWNTMPLIALCLYGISVSVILLAYIFAIRKNYRQENIDWYFSLTLITMLLVSPLGWMYYFGLLTISIILLLKYLATEHCERRLLIIIFCALFLINFPAVLHLAAAPENLSKGLDVYISLFNRLSIRAVYNYGLLLLFVSHLMILRRKAYPAVNSKALTLSREVMGMMLAVLVFCTLKALCELLFVV